MFVLSIVPGPSIFLVIARSMTSSLGRGLVTILGIVLANFIFILLAVIGVGALVASMDGLFTM
ncbi:LysE family transporter, partial [Verrucomicrobia bacterium]|nr:LysE family transporter [Verrucomicrobiota bacterium]